METSALVSIMASPREDHLKEVFHMFAFLRGNHNILMMFDPNKPNIDLSKFPREDCPASAYGKFKEELTPNAPQ